MRKVSVLIILLAAPGWAEDLTVGPTPYMELTRPDTRPPAWEPEPTTTPMGRYGAILKQNEIIEKIKNRMVPEPTPSPEFVLPKNVGKNGEVLVWACDHEWQDSPYISAISTGSIEFGWPPTVPLQSCSKCGLIRIPPKEKK